MFEQKFLVDDPDSFGLLEVPKSSITFIGTAAATEIADLEADLALHVKGERIHFLLSFSNTAANLQTEIVEATNAGLRVEELLVFADKKKTYLTAEDIWNLACSGEPSLFVDQMEQYVRRVLVDVLVQEFKESSVVIEGWDKDREGEFLKVHLFVARNGVVHLKYRFRIPYEDALAVFKDTRQAVT